MTGMASVSSTTDMGSIACGTVTQAGNRTVTTCTFGNSLTGVQSAPMFPGRWDLTVFAARTGQVVGHAKFVGDQPACPTVAFSQNGQIPSLLTDPGVQQLRAVLARYVR